MQAIQTQGVWWLPENPGQKSFGTLSCNEAGEVRLSLVGGFAESPLSYDRSYPILFGEVAEHKKGEQVTLKDCLLTNQVFSSNRLDCRQELLAHRAFFGAHLVKDTDFAFGHVQVSYSGLAPWASGLTGFTRKSDMMSAAWVHPQHLTAETPWGSFVLGVGCESSGLIREIVLREFVDFNLSFPEPVPEVDLQKRWIYSLQNFLTFATDKPNALTKLVAARHMFASEHLTIIGPMTFSDELAASDALPFQMLFSLEDVKDRLDDVITKWLTLSDAFAEVFALYFGGIYRPAGYTDFRFTWIIHVLALYQMKRGDLAKAVMPVDTFTSLLERVVPRDVMPTVQDFLTSHPMVGAERALRVLTHEHGDEIRPLIAPNGPKEVESFLVYALNTVHYTLTREPRAETYAADGPALYWLSECTAFLFKISLLKEIGFSKDKIRNILDRNPRYVHIRDSIKPHTMWESRPA